jgi:hypothetical protein
LHQEVDLRLRLARPRKAQCGIDSLYAGEDFGIAGIGSVWARVVSKPLETMRIVIVASLELASNHCGEYHGVDVYECKHRFSRHVALPHGHRS